MLKKKRILALLLICVTLVLSACVGKSQSSGKSSLPIFKSEFDKKSIKYWIEFEKFVLDTFFSYRKSNPGKLENYKITLKSSYIDLEAQQLRVEIYNLNQEKETIIRENIIDSTELKFVNYSIDVPDDFKSSYKEDDIGYWGDMSMYFFEKVHAYEIQNPGVLEEKDITMGNVEVIEGEVRIGVLRLTEEKEEFIRENIYNHKAFIFYNAEGDAVLE